MMTSALMYKQFHDESSLVCIRLGLLHGWLSRPLSWEDAFIPESMGDVKAMLWEGKRPARWSTAEFLDGRMKIVRITKDSAC